MAGLRCRRGCVRRRRSRTSGGSRNASGSRDCARHARRGAGRWSSLSGEPGIGKTRLAAHTALEAHSAGCTICWGAAAEDLGAPYGPGSRRCPTTSSTLRKRCSRAHVDATAASSRAWSRGHWPVGSRGVPAPQHADSETERFLLFEAVAGSPADRRWLHRPVVLVLDDLQWADRQSSRSLLKHVAVSTADPRCWSWPSIGSPTSNGAIRSPTWLRTCAAWRASSARMLRGLETDEVAEVCGRGRGQSWKRRGCGPATGRPETEGNPFFVAELLRHLSESGAIAQRRFDGPGGRCDRRSRTWACQVACAKSSHAGWRDSASDGADPHRAAVVGRTFDVELLDLLVKGDEDDLLDALAGGAQASSLVESPSASGRFSFAHALISHALYDALGRGPAWPTSPAVAEALEQLSSRSRASGWWRGSWRTPPVPRPARPWSCPTTGARRATKGGRWITCSRPPSGRSVPARSQRR